MQKVIRFLRDLAKPAEFQDPPFARQLFGNPAWSWIWLVLRLYLGQKWIEAGWHKINSPQWMSTGEALKGFWQHAVAVPTPPASPPISYDWYRSFIQWLLDGGHYVWFAKLVAIGELAIGIALILGLFVGITAFTGAFMNWNFMMAGTASVNPFFFVISLALMMAWKTSGWIGMDRWVLPLVGTPWQPGKLFRRHPPGAAAPQAAPSGGGASG